jgi:hypothetical protein
MNADQRGSGLNKWLMIRVIRVIRGKNFLFFLFLFSGFGGGAGAEQGLELGHECRQVFEFEIDRSEAHIRDLVERLQPPHDELADVARRQLAVERILNVLFNLIGDGFQLRGRDGALFGRAEEAGEHLVAVKGLTLAVLFDDHVWDLVDALVRRESAPALEALAATADRAAVLRFTRINDLILYM